MFGIKIGKKHRKDGASAWPGEYHRLDVIIRPVEDALEGLWWATPHVKYSFPTEWVLEGSAEGGDGWTPLTGPSSQKFDQSFFLGTNAKVAKPGFLPTYAHVVSGDWSILYGLRENPAADWPLLEALDHLDWFAPVTEFPSPVLVCIRGVDWAYWELFARDQTLVAAIHDHLRDVPGLTFELLNAALPETA